jgi:hypothetical protein
MPSTEILHNVDFVRTDVSEERNSSIIRVTRISEQAAKKYHVAACVGCWLLIALFLDHRFLSL